MTKQKTKTTKKPAKTAKPTTAKRTKYVPPVFTPEDLARHAKYRADEAASFAALDAHQPSALFAKPLFRLRLTRPEDTMLGYHLIDVLQVVPTTSARGFHCQMFVCTMLSSHGGRWTHGTFHDDDEIEDISMCYEVVPSPADPRSDDGWKRDADAFAASLTAERDQARDQASKLAVGVVELKVDLDLAFAERDKALADVVRLRAALEATGMRNADGTLEDDGVATDDANVIDQRGVPS